MAGLASVAAVPVGIVLTRREDLDLIQAGWAVVPGLLLGLLALAFARGARRRSQRTIGRVGGLGLTRLGRLLGLVGVYIALTGAVALGVYEILNRLSY
jgi:hypothetical protein